MEPLPIPLVSLLNPAFCFCFFGISVSFWPNSDQKTSRQESLQKAFFGKISMGEWIKSCFLLLVCVLFKFSLVVFATKVIVSIWFNRLVPFWTAWWMDDTLNQMAKMSTSTLKLTPNISLQCTISRSSACGLVIQWKHAHNCRFYFCKRLKMILWQNFEFGSLIHAVYLAKCQPGDSTSAVSLVRSFTVYNKTIFRKAPKLVLNAFRPVGFAC